jgi:DNA-binding transcriptional regulator YhcF (GntR family)
MTTFLKLYNVGVPLKALSGIFVEYERMAIIDTHATRDAQLPQNGEDEQHLSRKLKMSNLLDKTISEMRSLGASDNDIASTLRHAVDVLEACGD